MVDKRPIQDLIHTLRRQYTLNNDGGGNDGRCRVNNKDLLDMLRIAEKLEQQNYQSKRQRKVGDSCKTFEVDNFLVQENGIVRDRDTGEFLFRLDSAEKLRMQPIETAPRDGGVILGYDPSWYDIATPMIFNGKRWVFFHVQDSEIRATHWMPMPKLPIAGE